CPVAAIANQRTYPPISAPDIFDCIDARDLDVESRLCVLVVEGQRLLRRAIPLSVGSAGAAADPQQFNLQESREFGLGGLFGVRWHISRTEQGELTDGNGVRALRGTRWLVGLCICRLGLVCRGCFRG